MVGVKRQKETLGRKFGFCELGGVFICRYSQMKFMVIRTQISALVSTSDSFNQLD